MTALDSTQEFILLDALLDACDPILSYYWKEMKARGRLQNSAILVFDPFHPTRCIKSS